MLSYYDTPKSEVMRHEVWMKKGQRSIIVFNSDQLNFCWPVQIYYSASRFLTFEEPEKSWLSISGQIIFQKFYSCTWIFDVYFSFISRWWLTTMSWPATWKIYLICLFEFCWTRLVDLSVNSLFFNYCVSLFYIYWIRGDEKKKFKNSNIIRQLNGVWTWTHVPIKVLESKYRTL